MLIAEAAQILEARDRLHDVATGGGGGTGGRGFCGADRDVRFSRIFLIGHRFLGAFKRVSQYRVESRICQNRITIFSGAFAATRPLTARSDGRYSAAATRGKPAGRRR